MDVSICDLVLVRFIEQLFKDYIKCNSKKSNGHYVEFIGIKSVEICFMDPAVKDIKIVDAWHFNPCNNPDTYEVVMGDLNDYIAIDKKSVVLDNDKQPTNYPYLVDDCDKVRVIYLNFYDNSTIAMSQFKGHKWNLTD